MEKNSLNILGLVFWTLVALSLTILLFIYFYLTNKALLILAFIPVISLLAFLLGGRYKNNINYGPNNMMEFTITNLIFLLLFLSTLFLLGKNFNFLKIGLFIIMSSVGWYNTYYVLKNRLFNKT